MYEQLVTFLATQLHWLIIAIAVGAVACSPKNHRLNTVLITIVALPLAYGLGELASILVYSPRPFVELEVLPLIPHEANNGFPSSHALLAMTVAGIVYVHNRMIGRVLVVLAALVAVGRILALVHSVTDVVMSWLITAVAVIVGVYVASAIQSKYTYGSRT